MLRRKPLSVAVAVALGAASTTGLMASSAYAEEAADAAIEEVVVTGSRIKTSVSDAPRPVSVMNRLDIELSGMESVADVLRNSSYNSIGSFRERSGSSGGQIAQIDLKGLGPSRTAVLVNGRRVPGNPITGTSAVDLNTIPLSAVERVEVLTDSASAIYGADAIAGVINIIFREDFEGFEFEVGADRPTREGAESEHFNFTFGARGDKSSILFSGEWFKRDPIFDADRDYSKVRVTANPNGGLPRLDVDTVGVSWAGNTGFNTSFSQSFKAGPGETCPGTTYIEIQEAFGIPGEGCGFGYADLSMQTGGIDRKSTYLDARYEINDDMTAYFENRYTRSATFGRYAPAAAFVVVDADAPLNEYDPDGDGNANTFFLGHRFIAHGNRDENYSTDEFDSILGLRGTLDVAGGVNYDVFVRRYEYRSPNQGRGYVLTSNLEAAILDGSYNFLNPLDPDNAAAVTATGATTTRDIETEFNQFGITFDGALFDLPAGQIGWAAGYEMAEENYIDRYDSAREAGNVSGTAGNSSAGGRKRWAAFAEFQIPILDNLDANVAFRHDDYDDFGEEFSPQVALRWQPIDMLTVRASWGEGFKAPNLGNIGQSLSQSFNDVVDLKQCRANGIADADCPNTQAENYRGGNPDLQAELSESWNVGLVVDPIDGLTFSVDWWNIEIEDKVSLLSLQNVINFEIAGTLPPGVIVNRSAEGALTRCVGTTKAPNCGIINPFANLAASEHEGIDIRAQYNLDTDNLGAFQATLEYSKLRTWDEKATPIAAESDFIGTEGVPEFRYNLGVRWTMNDWTVNYTYHYIDEFQGSTAASKYDDYDTMDLNVTWTTPWNGELSFGARNLTDEDPIIDSNGQYEDDVVLYLYDVAGRVPYVSYKHFF